MRTQQRRRHTAPRPARWMDLKYAGRCQVCHATLPVGTRAFYDPRDRSVTCTSIECAKAAGITKQEWHGSPVSGNWVDVLSETRLGTQVQHAEWTDDDYARGHSATQTWKQRHGRCEDAPCCGCCD